MRRFRSRESDNEHYGSKSVQAQLLGYAPPWALGVALLVGAAITHAMWGSKAQVAPWAAVGLTMSGTVLTWLTWVAGKARGLITQVHATVSTGAGSVWMTTATIAGVTAQPLLSLYLLLAPVLAISWNIRRMLRGRGEGDGWSEASEKVGLLGATLSRPQIEGTKVTADVQLVPGSQTLDDLQSATKRIASLFGVRRDGVRATPHPDREDRAKLVIVPKDMLRKVVPWPGPSHPGGSAADPIHAGVYEDGEIARYWLPGDVSQQRNATHFLFMGINGAGKSDCALGGVAELLSRRDTVVWVADPIKGEQTFGDIKDGLDWFATTKQGAKAMLRALENVITARANYLGSTGYKQWAIGCGIPHLTVLFEEAAGYLSDSRLLVRLVQQARSVGISIWISLQRASYSSLPVDARQQLGAALCFGVKDDSDAEFALSDHVLDAGASPGTWGNRHPGYAYLEAPGISPERWVTPLRSYLTQPEQLRAVVTDYAPIRAQLDQTSAQAAGAEYAKRNGSISAAAHAADVAPGTVTSIVINPSTQTTKETEMDDEFDEAVDSAFQKDEDTEEIELPANAEPGFLDDIDPSKEIPEDDDPRFVIAKPSDDTKPPTHIARQMLRDHLTKLAEAGQATVRPAELVEIRAKIGRSPAWLTGELKRLVEGGMLAPHPDHGVYMLRAPVGV